MSTFISLEAAQHLHQAGRLAEAKAAYLDFLDGLTAETDHGTIASVYNNLGAIFAVEQEWEAAILAYEEAIALLPTYVDAYYNLGVAAFHLTLFDKAREAFQAIFKISTDHPGAACYLGMIALAQDHPEEALHYFLPFTDRFPHHVATLANIGLCYIKQENWQAALTYYQKAHAIQANDKEILYNLGVIAEKLNQNQTALDYYLDAIRVDPRYYEAENNVSALYLKMGHREEALNHYQALLKLLPADEAISHTIKILSRDDTVRTSPPGYIKALFDGYADHYDAHLNTTLHYQVPAALYHAVLPYCDFMKPDFRMLDLGCGTGLSAAPFLQALAKNPSYQLIGVDLSEKMLALAKSKGGYTELNMLDILTFMQQNQVPFDLIIAGDVLVYMGELAPLFASVSTALTVGGVFALTIEAKTIEAKEHGDFSLNPSGRFTHSDTYLTSLIEKHALQLIEKHAMTLREQNDAPVPGWLIVCQEKVCQKKGCQEK